MSTNESVLNNMLELCEKQMSEGDYLIAASLLKIVNEKKETKTQFRTITFDSPINIRAEKLNLNIHSIVQKLVTNPYNSYHVTVSINVQFTNDIFTIKKVSFESWLSFVIQKEMAIDVKLSDNLSPASNITYEKYKKFLIERDQLDDECEEWMYGSYSRYISDLSMQIIELKTKIVT